MDTENLVALITEMRALFNDQQGINLTLAAGCWDLRRFDLKTMESYVDFLGLMASDLHGSWDSAVEIRGSIVRGQADIREIHNDTQPLWFDALDPAKIKLGLAYYGRGYTLTSPSCANLGCPFMEPSLPGPCTNYSWCLVSWGKESHAGIVAGTNDEIDHLGRSVDRV